MGGGQGLYPDIDVVRGVDAAGARDVQDDDVITRAQIIGGGERELDPAVARAQGGDVHIPRRGQESVWGAARPVAAGVAVEPGHDVAGGRVQLSEHEGRRLEVLPGVSGERLGGRLVDPLPERERPGARLVDVVVDPAGAGGRRGAHARGRALRGRRRDGGRRRGAWGHARGLARAGALRGARRDARGLGGAGADGRAPCGRRDARGGGRAGAWADAGAL